MNNALIILIQIILLYCSYHLIVTGIGFKIGYYRYYSFISNKQIREIKLWLKKWFPITHKRYWGTIDEYTKSVDGRIIGMEGI